MVQTCGTSEAIALSYPQLPMVCLRSTHRNEDAFLIVVHDYYFRDSEVTPSIRCSWQLQSLILYWEGEKPPKCVLSVRAPACLPKTGCLCFLGY